MRGLSVRDSIHDDSECTKWNKWSMRIVTLHMKYASRQETHD
jgi:hypothetical protein